MRTQIYWYILIKEGNFSYHLTTFFQYEACALIPCIQMLVLSYKQIMHCKDTYTIKSLDLGNESRESLTSIS